MTRRAVLSLAAIIVGVIAVFVIVWAIWGPDVAAAAATVAAIPIALATVAAPPIFRKSKQPTIPVMVVSGEDDDDQSAFHYQYRHESSRLVITPRDPYLELLRSGGQISPASAFQSPWRHAFKWPTLDIKLVNNTDSTLYFMK